MSGTAHLAWTPEDLSHLFVERLNAQDIDGLVELYEVDAVLATTDGGVVRGQDEIRLCTGG